MLNDTPTPVLIQADSNTCAFGNPKELLSYIIGDAPVITLNVREKDFRAIYPSPVQSGEHQTLIEQHLSGDFSPRQCTRKDGSAFANTNHYALGAYSVNRNADGSFTTVSLTLDVDGPDHDKGRSQDDVDAAARNLYKTLDEEGLCPFLARSHGGRGYHIWVVFV
jgi:hypothetical protein